jgi:hypothetical protein
VNSPSSAENWPVAGDLRLATVGGDQGRQDPHRRRLAGTIRPQEGEDRPFSDVEIEAVEHDLLAIRLAQPGGMDRRPDPGGRHAAPPGRATRN